MSENTKIEWADHSFNPWIGCTKVGPGCDNCYAKADFDDRRHRVVWGAGQPRSRTKTWGDPVKWNKQADAFFAEHGRRQRVFCASLADVFDNEVPQFWRTSLFGLIYDTPHLDWLLLTKRIGNAERMIKEDAPEGIDMAALPNVWIGATICNQEEADRDIGKLMAVPAAKRFLSMEPLLGPVELGLQCENWSDDIVMDPETGAYECCKACDFTGIGNAIDWVIVGGESGPNARPMHPDWARGLRDQCEAAGVAFMFKQWGEWREPIPGEDFDTSLGRAAKPPAFIISHDGTVRCFEDDRFINPKVVIRVGKKAAGRLLDGREWNGVPA